jgi:hypothetical protein
MKALPMQSMRKGRWKHCLLFGFLPFLNSLWAEEALADETLFRPLEQPKEWSFTDAAAWRWERGPGQESNLVLHRPSQYKPPVRSPLNIAWFEGRTWKSFTLTAEVRLDLFNEGNNDLCLFFAGKGPREFCYAHLGETADGVHLHLHRVANADREPVTSSRAETLPWKPRTWHRVRLSCDAENGEVRVWFDEGAKPVLEARFGPLPEGRIGLGSFDDLGAFRRLVVRPGVEKALPAPEASGPEFFSDK